MIDPRLQYEGRFSEASDVLVLKIPRHLLEARLGEIREIDRARDQALYGREQSALRQPRDASDPHAKSGPGR